MIGLREGQGWRGIFREEVSRVFFAETGRFGRLAGREARPVRHAPGGPFVAGALPHGRAPVGGKAVWRVSVFCCDISSMKEGGRGRKRAEEGAAIRNFKNSQPII